MRYGLSPTADVPSHTSGAAMSQWWVEPTPRRVTGSGEATPAPRHTGHHSNQRDRRRNQRDALYIHAWRQNRPAHPRYTGWFATCWTITRTPEVSPPD